LKSAARDGDSDGSFVRRASLTVSGEVSTDMP
jgi:hypothetical protein